MAVSKRTRFEVFKRDDHTCRYCGQSAPDVKITIDHVVPVALGGNDDPTNLVSACIDCNAGKSSSAPTAEAVADVSESQMRYAKLAKAAWEVRVQEIGRKDEWVDEAIELIGFPMPPEARKSLGRFYELGVPMEVAADAIEIAGTKYDPSGRMDRFTYMCGILWNVVKEVGYAVQESIDMDGCWYTEGQIYDLRYEAHRQGVERGWKEGLRVGRLEPDRQTAALAYVIEGSYSKVQRALDPREALAACG